jgi:hypothetical protein
MGRGRPGAFSPVFLAIYPTAVGPNPVPPITRMTAIKQPLESCGKLTMTLDWVHRNRRMSKVL